jgi:dTDP-4-amino-4,6-dideoxygalactose transaminase
VLRPSQLVSRSRREVGLPFPLNAHGSYYYVARGAIYQLIKALGRGRVLVPAYHHGNEVKAIRAAGAEVCFYPIDRQLMPDLDALDRLARGGARVLFSIHYLGWAQPIRVLRALSRERGLVLVEDCALALLSETDDGAPLGSFGDYAVFCLYKTVAVPNGGLLVQNHGAAARLNGNVRPPDFVSVAARTSELMLQWVRSRSDLSGRALMGLKRMAGRSLSAARVRRLPVGDQGFGPALADTAMSPFCLGLLKRFDYEAIRARRRANFLHLQERLAGRTTPLERQLDEGVCPLFFPLLVRDKAAAFRALEQRGVETVEFWNTGDPEADAARFPDVRFLREHVLELPVHQDVTPDQVDYVADQVLKLDLRL